MAKNQLAAWKGVLDQDSAWHSVICTVWALLEEVAVAEWINHSANLPSPAVHLAIGPCLGLGTEHSHMAILGLIQEYNLYIYIIWIYGFFQKWREKDKCVENDDWRWDFEVPLFSNYLANPYSLTVSNCSIHHWKWKLSNWPQHRSWSDFLPVAFGTKQILAKKLLDVWKREILKFLLWDGLLF